VQSPASADNIRKSLREGLSVDRNLRRVSPTHKTKLQNQPVRYTIFFVNNLWTFVKESISSIFFSVQKAESLHCKTKAIARTGNVFCSSSSR
jgi:hypothetical protein